MSRKDSPPPRSAGDEPEGSGASEPGDGPVEATPLLGTAWKVVASLAGLLVLVLLGGLLLPGRWSAEREAVLDAPPDSIFGYLNDLERWDRWSPWPDVELSRSDPPSGEGATMSWDDEYLGDGTFRIVESDPPSRLRYRVEVEGGAMTTTGTFVLDAVSRRGGAPGPDAEGADARGARTRVRWREEGDFGWNPLMGYAALTMDRVQGMELERGLERLEAVVETGELPDSLRPGPAGPYAPPPSATDTVGGEEDGVRPAA